jgi:hypothetical protein
MSRQSLAKNRSWSALLKPQRNGSQETANKIANLNNSKHLSWVIVANTPRSNENHPNGQLINLYRISAGDFHHGHRFHRRNRQGQVENARDAICLALGLSTLPVSQQGR